MESGFSEKMEDIIAAIREAARAENAVGFQRGTPSGM